MRKQICLIIAVLTLSGCASFLTTTGTKGVAFGMSKEQVLKRIERKYEIISQDDNTIVVEGSHD